MSRLVGTVVRGLRCPIIKEGDNLTQIVCDAVLEASSQENFELHDRDVVAVTESVVARAQGNYCTVDEIAEEVKQKFYPSTHLGVLFPILSRNRFSTILKGLARGMEHITLMLSFPADEVGNALVSREAVRNVGIEPSRMGLLLEKGFQQKFGKSTHPFTGVDYLAYYRQIIEEEGCTCDIYLGNDPRWILSYTKSVLCCDIHTRNQTKAALEKGADLSRVKILTLEDIMKDRSPYGLLGSNKATEETLKLFPHDSQEFVLRVQKQLLERTGKQLEVMVYGDGAFKDPVGGIWELADPVVSPGYTPGLEGTPNEVKIKYLADNNYGDLRGEELTKAIKQSIKEKDENLVGQMVAEGTTPRHLTDLLGSLCDLTSGSGDKGTPIVLVQGYFDNYAIE